MQFSHHKIQGKSENSKKYSSQFKDQAAERAARDEV